MGIARKDFLQAAGGLPSLPKLQREGDGSAKAVRTSVLFPYGNAQSYCVPFAPRVGWPLRRTFLTSPRARSMGGKKMNSENRSHPVLLRWMRLLLAGLTLGVVAVAPVHAAKSVAEPV